jgi:MFS family permease
MFVRLHQLGAEGRSHFPALVLDLPQSIRVALHILTQKRSPLASLVQFLVTVGIVVGYFLCYGTSRLHKTSLSWRLPLAFQALVAFCFALACLFLPPSPRWLLAKGRKAEALVTLEQLGLGTEEFEEMIEMPDGEGEKIADGNLIASVRARLAEITKVFGRNARKQTGLACFLMAMQQLSGIDGVLYYAPLLFQQAGLASEEASFLASGVSALLMLAVTIPASYWCDHWGRRSSTIIGFVFRHLLTHSSFTVEK